MTALLRTLTTIGDGRSHEKKTQIFGDSLDETPRFRRIIALSAATISFLTFIPSLRNDFLNWDDDLYIVANNHIRSIDTAFFRWAFLDFHAGNWHPLAWISHASDYMLWGLNPFGHHLMNSLLHALNVFLVVMLTAAVLDAGRRRTAQSGPAPLREISIKIAAGTTGLLFGIHPLHVESVTWISERKDVLCCLFYLSCVLAYTAYLSRADDRDRKHPVLPFADLRYLSALVLFILALLSKPMAVTLPLVLLLVDWFPYGRIRSVNTFGAALFEKTPFLAGSLMVSILAILAQKTGGALGLMEQTGLSTRMLIAVHSLVSYLHKMVWPFGLIPFYPYPHEVSISSPKYMLSLFTVAALFVLTIIAAIKKQKTWLAVWGYYVITLLPVLGIVQAGGQSMADRYTYLPSLGPFLVAGLGIAWVWERAAPAKNTVGGARAAVVILAVTTFIILVSLTVRQTGIWKNSLSFWSYVIEWQPHEVPEAYYNRGLVFGEKGQYDMAIRDFDTAISLRPRYAEAFLCRGIYQSKAGMVDQAITDFDTAILLNPRNGAAFYHRGTYQAKAGAFPQAIEDFNLSIALNPDHADSYLNRGIAYELTGQYDRAVLDFTTALRIDGQSGLAYFNRGTVYERTGERSLALLDFGKACELGLEEGCRAAQALP